MIKKTGNFILGLLFVLLVLVLGVIKIVTQQHPPQSENFSIVNERGVSAVYLTRQILRPHKYKKLVVWLNSTHNQGNLKMYLCGTGGSVVTVLSLLGSFDLKKHRKVEMVVYCNVYSGHAFLAMSGDKLTIANDQVLFMFHRAAWEISNMETILPEIECLTRKGVNRGYTNKARCFHMLQYDVEHNKNTIYKGALSVMTKEEKQRFWIGQDVVLTGGQIKKRLKALRSKQQ